MYGYVYETTCLVNGKKYIGQHKSDHFDTKYYGSGTLFSRALHKYGKNNFTVRVLKECNSADELSIAETKAIQDADAVNSSNYYNITDSACGGGREFSPEYHKYLSQKAKERSQSDEFRQRMSELHRGKVLSEEHRATISKMCKERKWSDDIKAKMSESAKKIWANGREFIPHEMTPELKKYFSDLATKVHKGTRVVNNGVINRQVKPEIAEQLVADGWKYGMIPDKRKYVWVKKDGSCKRIFAEDLDSYLQQGWVRGKNYTNPQK